MFGLSPVPPPSPTLAAFLLFHGATRTFTAITNFAPIFRRTSAGTGLVKPPSTKHLPSDVAGTNIPGIEILALTACITEPFLITTSLPVLTSVATAANGIFKSLNSASPIRERRSASIFWPRISPFPKKLSLRSSIRATCLQPVCKAIF